MTAADWIVLFGTLALIVGYGTWKTRRNQNLKGYLLGGKEARWGTIGLSVMATQASAITFLSTPGKGFDSGMEFVQFYLGMPIALVVLCVTIIPLFYKLKVYTAYEFLETRFDLKTRLLTAFLFMVQRGLAAGLTIYAPAIILSSILGWNIAVANLLVGVLVIVYTVSGGTRAVSLTQKWQMAVIMAGMFIAFGILLHHITEHVSFGEAVRLAGDLGKMEIISWELDLNDRYNIWAALSGGIFLFMSYFGTDQSQVQRYISGRSIRESRLGLMFNGLLKIPMQFFIVFTGVMVFVFYQFEKAPVYFDQTITHQLKASAAAPQLADLDKKHATYFEERQASIALYLEANRNGNASKAEQHKADIQQLNASVKSLHKEVEHLAEAEGIRIRSKETDYVFIRWIVEYLPVGLIGLLIAVIFSAAMSSTAGELNALASTLTIDYYKRMVLKNGTDRQYLRASKWFTFGWGIWAIIFAFVFSMADNLIEVVNTVGSIFYGVILGIFLIAFYIRRFTGNTVFWSAIVAQILVLGIYYFKIFLPENESDQLGYLWLNVIGCTLVLVLAQMAHWVFPRAKAKTAR